MAERLAANLATYASQEEKTEQSCKEKEWADCSEKVGWSWLLKSKGKLDLVGLKVLLLSKISLCKCRLKEIILYIHEHHNYTLIFIKEVFRKFVRTESFAINHVLLNRIMISCWKECNYRKAKLKYVKYVSANWSWWICNVSISHYPVLIACTDHVLEIKILCVNYTVWKFVHAGWYILYCLLFCALVPWSLTHFPKQLNN